MPSDEDLIRCIKKSIEILEDQHAAPSEIRVTSKLYAQLKQHCTKPAEGREDSIFGVRVVVDDVNPHF